MQKSTTKNIEETQGLGQNFAREILASGIKKSAVVLALQGDLGAGKTTFLQGFAKGLGVREKINSPSFVILKRFGLRNKKFKNFYHIDCYRLKDEKDLEHFGFKEIIADPENIVAIEWSERIEKILPKGKTVIEFNHLEEGKRVIFRMLTK